MHVRTVLRPIRTHLRRLTLVQKLLAAFTTLLVLLIGMWANGQYLLRHYTQIESPALLDRNGALLTLFPNPKQQYGRFSDSFLSYTINLRSPRQKV